MPIGPGDLIIDCGANIGEFSKSVLRHGAEVTAVEPEETEARYINYNVCGVRAVIMKALWKVEGHVD